MNKPYLRVVWESKSGAPKSIIRQQQLSFPFIEVENLIACIGQEGLTGWRLSELLHTLRPSYFLDLRKCPRFDLNGYSRKQAFEEFERYGIQYLYLTTNEVDADLGNRVERLVEKLKGNSISISGPLVVMIETEEAVDHIIRTIPKPKTKSGTWEISIDGVAGQSESRAHLFAV